MNWGVYQITREHFPEIKIPCLSQPQNLSASGDYLEQALVLFWCYSRWLRWCSGDGLAAAQAAPEAAELHSPTRAVPTNAARAWQKLLCGSMHSTLPGALNLREVLEEIKTASCLGFGWKSEGKS